jgi:hypothetical protein
MRPVVAAFGKGRQLFVGHELIDRARLPEVAVREILDRDVARAFLVELEGDLAAVVGEAGLMIGYTVAVPTPPSAFGPPIQGVCRFNQNSLEK